MTVSPPVAYAPVWLILGLVLLAVVVVWPLLLWWWTRPGRGRARSEAAEVAPDPDARERALAALAELDRAHRAGAADDRATLLGLSRVVRDFVATVSGWPVDRMTLGELRTVMNRTPELGALTELIGVIQPPSFQRPGTTPAAVPGLIADGAELVRRWPRGSTAAAPPTGGTG